MIEARRKIITLISFLIGKVNISCSFRLFAFCLILLLPSCRNANQVIDFELPAYEKKLIVECYLEPGKVPYAIVTESVGLLDPPTLPVIPDAEVVVSWDGGADTLTFDPGSFTYSGTTVFPEEPDYSQTYSLFVDDSRGRQGTATTRFIEPVDFDSVNYDLVTKKKATVTVFFPDPVGAENFYRITMTGSKSEEKLRTRFTDDFVDGEQIAYVSSNRWRKGDTMTVKLYHILPEYYTFLHTLRRADVDGSVIAEPVSLIGNIEGGIGIFTALSYVETKFKIKKK